MFIIWGMLFSIAQAGNLTVEIQSGDTKPSQFEIENISPCFYQSFSFLDRNGVKNDIKVLTKPVKNSDDVMVRVDVKQHTESHSLDAAPSFILSNRRTGRLKTDAYTISVLAEGFTGDEACEYRRQQWPSNITGVQRTAKADE